MGWERRGTSGKSYFYLSRRDGAGVTVKEYVGTGDRAEAEAAELARRREARERENVALRDAESSTSVADSLSKELGEAASLLSDAVLLAAGYHRHNYGFWRKRRDNRKN